MDELSSRIFLYMVKQRKKRKKGEAELSKKEIQNQLNIVGDKLAEFNKAFGCLIEKEYIEKAPNTYKYRITESSNKTVVQTTKGALLIREILIPLMDPFGGFQGSEFIKRAKEKFSWFRENDFFALLDLKDEDYSFVKQNPDDENDFYKADAVSVMEDEKYYLQLLAESNPSIE